MKRITVVFLLLVTQLIAFPSEEAHATSYGDKAVIASGPSSQDGYCAVSFYGEFVCSDPNFYEVPNLDYSKQILLGWRYACAIRSSSTAVCWDGMSNSPFNLLPSNLPSIPAKQLDFVTVKDEPGVCGIFDDTWIQCWNFTVWSQISFGKNLGVEIKSIAQNCALTVDGSVKCFKNGTTVEVLSSQENVQKMVNGRGSDEVCVLTGSNVMKCFQSSFTTNPTALSTGIADVTDIVDGPQQVCYLQGGNPWKCLTSSGPVTLDVAGTVQQIIPTWSKPCAFVADQMVCPSKGQVFPGHIGPDVKLPETGLTSTLTATGEVELSFDFTYQPNYGLVNWVIKDKDGDTECTFSKTTQVRNRCVVAPNSGGSYRWSLIGTNRSGSTNESFTSYINFCPPNAQMSLTASSAGVTKGKTVILSVQLSNFCSADNVVQIRQRLIGKTWGAWKSYRTSSTVLNKSFKISDATEFEANVTNNGAKFAKKSVVKLKLATALPYTISSTPLKNAQGFLQGGKISVKFSGETSYSGLCALNADTSSAYNFAGTLMGREGKISVFKVTNGKGSTTLTTRWSGRFTVIALCTSSKYLDVSDLRYVTFKLNF